MHEYMAVVRSVVDGDTLRLDIDFGMDEWRHNQRLRLFGVNAPSITGVTREQGLMAKAFVEQMCPPGTQVIINTIVNRGGTEQVEKYGRYLVTVYVEGQSMNLGDMLVAEGLAVEYDGHGPRDLKAGSSR